MPHPAVSIRHARVQHARPGDRARLVEALGGISPASTGVPAGALLVIGHLRSERRLSAPREVLQDALIDQIRARKAAARRAGQLGENADAYFPDADAVEIAAVAQWLERGRVDPLLISLDPTLAAPERRWRRTVLSDPRRLPELVVRLLDQGLAAPWFARFGASELEAAADRIMAEHGAALPRPAPRPQPGEAATLASATSAEVQLPAAIEAALHRAAREPGPPALPLLIAVATLAAQRPDLLATRAVRPALIAIAAGGLPERQSADPPAAASRPAEAGGDPFQPPVVIEGPVSLPSSEPVPGRAHRRAAPPGQTASPVIQGTEPSPDTVRIDPEPAPPTTTMTPVAVAPSSAQPEALPLRSVTSEHAGLLFLINVLLALGLYGDFTRPADGLRGLSPFELLLLLGRRWLGQHFEQDPLAPLLRQLAALGPRERVGKSFTAPDWQVEPGWLAPWGDAPPQLRRGAPWHPAGFPLADAAPPGAGAAQRRRRWLAALARYLEARIARALGSTDRKAALRQMLKQRGTVRLHGSELVCAFCLDSHPIELRLAGIDRDPGWVPSAARTVRFEFT